MCCKNYIGQMDSIEKTFVSAVFPKLKIRQWSEIFER